MRLMSELDNLTMQLSHVGKKKNSAQMHTFLLCIAEMALVFCEIRKRIHLKRKSKDLASLQVEHKKITTLAVMAFTCHCIGAQL